MSTNLTDNAVGEEEEEDEEEFGLRVTIPLGIIISVIIIVAVVGNIFTIVAFIKDKRLHTVYNFYIVNLAVTDLLLGCISMPFYAVYTLKTFTWPFGYHFCKAFMVTDFTLCLETVLIMILLSLDRLLLLKQGPLYTNKETNNVAYIKIAISWMLAFLLYGPAIIGWDIWMGEDVIDPDDCDVQFSGNFEFTITTAVMEFGIPFICISVLNFVIYLEIRKRINFNESKSVRKPISVTLSRVSPSNVNNTSNNRVGNLKIKASNHTSTGGAALKQETRTVASLPKDTTKKLSVRKDLKAAKSLGLLVFVFAVTWAPYTVTTIIISACDSCVNEHAYEFLNWLLWTKAALNPFMYAYNCLRFREHFKSFMFCNNHKRNRVGIEHTVSTVG